MMHGYGFMGQGFFMPGMFFGFLLLVLVIWTIFSLGTKNKKITTREKAEDIISQRYAKGEISADEFDIMLEKLSK